MVSMIFNYYKTNDSTIILAPASPPEYYWFGPLILFYAFIYVFCVMNSGNYSGLSDVNLTSYVSLLLYTWSFIITSHDMDWVFIIELAVRFIYAILLLVTSF